MIEVFSLLELQPLTLALAIIGKCGAAAAFGVIYTYSLELYPTVLRNSGMGMSSCIARIGGMAAPYVAHSVGRSYCMNNSHVFINIDKIKYRKHTLKTVPCICR